MTCPKCGSDNLGVIRTNDEVDQIIRRRECRECGYRFNTVETDSDVYERLNKKKGNNDHADNK